MMTSGQHFSLECVTMDIASEHFYLIKYSEILIDKTETKSDTKVRKLIVPKFQSLNKKGKIVIPLFQDYGKRKR